MKRLSPLRATSSGTLDSSILDVLGGGWHSRRAISGQVANKHPDATTIRIYSRLTSLVRSGMIAPPHTVTCDFLDHSIYSLVPLTAIELVRCERLVQKKCEVLNRTVTKRMGTLGESLVRAVALRTGVYCQVTNWVDMGYVKPDDDTHVVDLVALHRDPLIGYLLFEVKNCEQHIEPHDDAIQKLMNKAIAQGALPVLVASNVSDETSRFCSGLGIAAIELGFQVVPPGVRKRLRRCERIVHLPDLVPLAWGSRPFKNRQRLPPWTTNLASALSQGEWLRTLRRRWDETRDWLSQSSRTSWKDLRKELASMSRAQLALASAA